MKVREIKSTSQVQRFCVHAKAKELYFEKRHALKRQLWKITSNVNCNIPCMEIFNEIVRQIEEFLIPKLSRAEYLRKTKW